MYVHGELLFPDYVAITLLAVVFTFLSSITAYGLVLTLNFNLTVKIRDLERFRNFGNFRNIWNFWDFRNLIHGVLKFTKSSFF